MDRQYGIHAIARMACNNFCATSDRVCAWSITPCFFGFYFQKAFQRFLCGGSWTHCLPANTPAHKALKLAVDSRSGDIPHHDWNRPAGRPRTTWMSQIVQDTGLTAADAWALADDRSTWRALRPTAGYAQQWVSEWAGLTCMGGNRRLQLSSLSVSVSIK